MSHCKIVLIRVFGCHQGDCKRNQAWRSIRKLRRPGHPRGRRGLSGRFVRGRLLVLPPREEVNTLRERHAFGEAHPRLRLGPPPLLIFFSENVTTVMDYHCSHCWSRPTLHTSQQWRKSFPQHHSPACHSIHTRLK